MTLDLKKTGAGTAESAARAPVARPGVWTAAVFIGALAIYIKSAVPDFVFDDNPEFVASAYLLGITHAPGYPLLSLLGKLFTYAAPGTAGFGVNLVSVFAGAGAMALCFRLLVRAGCGLEAALLGAAIAATSRLFWEQAVEAEVYSVNFFFIALLLNILWGITGGRRDAARFVALVLVTAVALINHYTIFLVIPVFAVYILWIYRRRLRVLLKWSAPAFFLALVAVSLLMYLPARSAAGPAINWDDQTTFTGFFNHIKGVDRRTETPSVPFGEKLRFVHDYGWRLTHERTPFLLLLLLPFGVWAAVSRLRARGALLAGLWFVLFSGFILMLNFLYGPRASYVIKAFHIASMQLIALFLGFGADAVLSALRRRKLPWQPVFAIIAVLVVWSALVNSETAVRADYMVAPVYGRNMLKTADRDGVVFSTLETESFPIACLRAVHGLRRDLTLYGRQGDITEAALTISRHDIPLDQMDDILDLESFVIQHTSVQRRLYFTKRLSIRSAEVEVHVNGLLYEFQPYLPKLARSDPWKNIDMTGIDPDYEHYDRIEKTMVSRYLIMQGEYRLELGEWDKAQEYFVRAARFNPESRFLRANLGAIYLTTGDYDRAREQYEKGLECDPENVEISIDTLAIYSNLSFIYGKFGMNDRALEYMEEAVRLSPDTAVLRINLGKTYWHNERWQDAIQELEASIKLGVDNAAAHNILGICYERIGLFKQAEKNYERALELNPLLAETYRDYGIFNMYTAGKPERAIELLTRYLELFQSAPDAPEIHVNLGFLNQTVGRHEQAVKEFETALQVGADNSPRRKAIIYDALAESLEQSGSLEQATGAFERGLEGAEFYPEIYRDYGEFLERVGDNAKLALEMFEKYLTAAPGAKDKLKAEVAADRLKARLGIKNNSGK